MGHKINPKNFRTPVLYTWPSKWFGGRNFANFLEEDVKIRDYIMKNFKEALLDKVEVERASNSFTVVVYATKPGIIIGRGGTGVENLKKDILTKILGRKEKLDINIIEVKKPLRSAQVVMQSVAFEIEKRLPFRKVLKQTIARVMKDGAKGIKVNISGRLNGAEIARQETLSAGKLPLHTLRADIDYSKGRAQMTYGTIGIKVWIYRDDIFTKEN